jgi:hypothetical protein
MIGPASDTVRRRLGKGYDEADHPRDAGGRWTAGDGASVDHDSLDDADREVINAVDARLDRHLGAIHEARRQAAEHVKALQGIQKTVEANHEQALDALDAHNDILDQYEEGVFEPILAEDSDEFDDASSFNEALKTSLAELKPHVHARKLK